MPPPGGDYPLWVSSDITYLRLLHGGDREPHSLSSPSEELDSQPATEPGLMLVSFRVLGPNFNN